MRITTRIVFDADNNVLEREWYEYSGPIALCDRAAQQEAKQSYRDARDTAAQERSAADSSRAQLTPFYRQEMNAQHGFNPEQTNELLNYAGESAGGGMGTVQGEANSQMARTRNTSGFAPALDQASRDRQKLMGSANLGIGAQDIAGAKALNQAGAAGMQGMYGTDTSAMLGAMGQQAPDINAQTTAGKSGWFQNMTDAIRAGASLISALKPGGMGMGGGGGGGG
jgi:hypothetical protein